MPFFTATPDGLKVAIKLTPKAKKNAVTGWAEDAEGEPVLKVSVTAVPEKGKANAALFKLLSKEWKIAKSSLELVSGATDRRKMVLISGDAKALGAQIAQWMEETDVRS